MAGTVSQQHVAGLAVLVGGSPLAQEYMDRIRSVKVRNIRMLPDVCVLQIQDPKAKDMDHHPLAVGSEIEIKLGSRTSSETKRVFKGQIASAQPDFKAEAVNISVVAYDKAHKLDRAKKSNTWQDSTSADIVKKVGESNGLRAGTLQSRGGPHKYMAQVNESDWDFCWRLASMEDAEFVVEDNQFHFRPASESQRELTLKLGERLRAFRPRVTGVQQIKEVVVKGYDPHSNQVIEGRANSPQRSSSNGTDPSKMGDELGGGTVTITDVPVENVQQANEIAASRLNQLADAGIEAEGVTDGMPELVAGVKVKIEGCGQKFSGSYTVTSVEHTWSSGGYETTFRISGRSPRTLTDLLTPTPKRSYTDSLVIGVVTNNNDPQKMGRVRVKFPTLEGEQESNWAQVATPSSGKGRGILCLPVKDETVVVAFEHGDVRRPIVIGSLFNGRQQPGENLAYPDGSFGVRSDKNIRMESVQSTTIVTGGDMTIEVSGDESVTISGDSALTVKGNVSEMVSGKSEHTISGSLKINASGTVEIVSAGSLKLTAGATIDVTAGAALNLKGATVNLG